MSNLSTIIYRFALGNFARFSESNQKSSLKHNVCGCVLSICVCLLTRPMFVCLSALGLTVCVGYLSVCVLPRCMWLCAWNRGNCRVATPTVRGASLAHTSCYWNCPWPNPLPHHHFPVVTPASPQHHQALSLPVTIFSL